jgi:hypothetical protein
MLLDVVSERVGIRKALRTLGTLEAANAVVEGLQMSPQCELGGIRLLAVRVVTALFFHLMCKVYYANRSDFNA